MKRWLRSLLGLFAMALVFTFVCRTGMNADAAPDRQSLQPISPASILLETMDLPFSPSTQTYDAPASAGGRAYLIPPSFDGDAHRMTLLPPSRSDDAVQLLLLEETAVSAEAYAP